MRLNYTLALALLLGGVASAQPKKSVAVLNFDYSTVQSYVSSIFGTNQDVGKGVSDLLVEKLVKAGNYRVIERKAIQSVLSEQNFSNSDRADPNTAAKIGKVLGADAIIIGSITQFGRDDQNVRVGGGGFGGRLSQYGIGGVGRKNSKAVVALTARVVSTDTGEILTVASGKGESTRSGTSLLGAGGSGGSGGGGAIDMSSSNFANTVLGEAVNAATSSLANELNAGATKVPTRVVNIEALVADVSGDTIIINAGTRAGVKVGDKLAVKRTGREIRDPASGKVIRRIEEPLGEVTITEADETSAVGKYSGPGTPKVGDAIRSRQP